MLKVGLTGGIACGKSHVLRGLAGAGFATLDLDAISHDVLDQDHEAAVEVAEAFGASVVSGSGGIDRRALGGLVFGSREARARLNAILHPRIRAVEEERTRELASSADVVVIDGALLIESGGHLRFDRLIVVHCPVDKQVERLGRRDGLDAAAARQRIESQMTSDEKRRFASFEVDTAGSAAETDGQVADLARRLREVAAEERPWMRPRASHAVACLASLPERGPRGTDLIGLLAAAGESGRFDLSQMASRLVPPARGAWYEAADEAPTETGPEGVGVVVALWCLASRPSDPNFAVAAAAAAGRLTHRDAAAIGGACLLAEAVLVVGRKGRMPGEWRSELSVWRGEAARWGQPAVSAEVARALDAAAANAGDAVAARAGAGPSRIGGALAGSLVGLGVGLTDVEAISPRLDEVVQSLGLV
jgi:dephospho-CoA kinase